MRRTQDRIGDVSLKAPRNNTLQRTALHLLMHAASGGVRCFHTPMDLTFDPVAAAKAYAGMDTEELVRIAYLEPDYVPEAKALALRELDNRGIPGNRKNLIRQVRDEIRGRDRASERRSAKNFEQLQTLKFRIAAGSLICGLWFIALFAPAMIEEWSKTADGAGFFLLGVWAIAAIDAVRKARRGTRRQLYLVVVVPVILLLVGITIRLVK